MSFAIIKNICKGLKIYPQVRSLNRIIRDRADYKRYCEDLMFFSKMINENDLVFDVGANYGIKSEVFLKLGAKVIAFEPQRDCYLELLSRIGHKKKLVALNTALGSRVSKETLYVRSHRGSSGLVKNWGEKIENTIEVTVSTLDNMIDLYGIPKYCKIDVEGYEFEVLSGLVKYQIPLISVEYHLKYQEDIAKVKKILKKFASSKILLNITPAETLRFAFKEWVDVNTFINIFDNYLNLFDGYVYGDLFIKVLTEKDLYTAPLQAAE